MKYYLSCCSPSISGPACIISTAAEDYTLHVIRAAFLTHKAARLWFQLGTWLISQWNFFMPISSIAWLPRLQNSPHRSKTHILSQTREAQVPDFGVAKFVIACNLPIRLPCGSKVLRSIHFQHDLIAGARDETHVHDPAFAHLWEEIVSLM